MVDQHRVIELPPLRRAVLVLLDPARHADAVAASQPLGAVARLEAERGDAHVDEAGLLPPAAGVARHGKPHRAARQFGAVLAQVGILDEEPGQGDRVHRLGPGPAIPCACMGGLSSCAGPGALQRRRAA